MSRDYIFSVGAAYGQIAERQGDAPALKMCDGDVVSYGSLNRRANQLAGVLGRRGVRRGDVVGIVHTKTLACYAGMLAALKLGAAYVNLDDLNPPTRSAHIFGSCRPKVVLGERLPGPLREAAERAGATILDLAEPENARDLAAAGDADPDEVGLVTGADPAYIMYTSGSTGVPKGAIITHGGVLNFGAWAGSRFAIASVDTLTNVNPMYFDNSVFDLYAALLNGASLAPIPRDVLADGPAMLAALEATRCTIWFSVPSLLIYLTTMRLLSPERLPSVRTFVFGGEGYPKPELRKLFAAFGGRSTLVNVYGPTECTCICSAWDVSAADLEDPNGLVTLGPVAENFSMLVVDEAGQPVGANGTGELCLLGPQVGLGYVNDPERTASAFVNNPANAAWPERMYRTGDRVAVAADGRSLDFVGRKDNQIKHMGYRIELDEIEAALNQLDGVVQSAVLQIAGRRTSKMLVACVSTTPEASEAALRDGLATLLPPYMIPQRFELRRELPKNANGKVDRLALTREFSA
jgi:D-alanine--poly(phosphoribitol) ligase subunit 1